MDERNKLKKYSWLFVLMFVIIIFLIFICIKYFIKNRETINKENISNNIFSDYPSKNDDSTISFELNDLLKETNINLNENFQDKEFQYKDKKLYYKITCLDYNEDYLRNGEKYSCRAVEMQVQYRLYRLFTNPNNCQRKINVILYKDYIIEHIVGDCADGCGTINIFNEGTLLKTIKNINANPKLTNSDDNNYVKKVNDYIYYFEDIGKYTYLKKLDFNNLNSRGIELAKINNENMSCENK